MIMTSHGSISVEEIGEGDLPVLLIHGNSSSKGVFRYQLQSQLPEHLRLVAFDLPGHGRSSNALDPMRTYTLSGFADAAVELVAKMNIADVIVFGWSLGGHIGIELMHHLPAMRGLMISGSPPLDRENFAQGFMGLPQVRAAAREDLNDTDIDDFVEAIFGKSAEPFLRKEMARADGRLRKVLFEHRAKDGADQRLTAETSQIPLAVVNGGADRIVNLDYFDGVSFANLWEGKCYRLPGLVTHLFGNLRMVSTHSSNVLPVTLSPAIVVCSKHS